MQNIDLLHPQHPKSRTSMAFSTAMLPASPSICAPTSHTCRQMVTSNSYATWASTTLHPLMCPRSMHWAIVALQACWRSVCSTTFPHPCLIYQVTHRPSVKSHRNPKGEDPGGEVTSSFAATSPTLLAAAKCVWMMRKAGLPMPLPAASARFPVPVVGTAAQFKACQMNHAVALWLHPQYLRPVPESAACRTAGWCRFCSCLGAIGICFRCADCLHNGSGNSAKWRKTWPDWIHESSCKVSHCRHECCLAPHPCCQHVHNPGSAPARSRKACGGAKAVAISRLMPSVPSASASMRHRLGSSSNTVPSRPPTCMQRTLS